MSGYKFVKVEDYFANFKSWHKLEKVDSYSFNANKKTLTLEFKKSDDSRCAMLLQFAEYDTFRLRFNPGKTEQDYTPQNTRAVVMDTFDELRTTLEGMKPFEISFDDTTSSDRLQVTTSVDNQSFMKMVVIYAPFSIAVFKYSNAQEFQVWKTAEPGIYYTPNGDEDYAIIQAVSKPITARYIGFGEQGGKALSKNTVQLNYFNFDNMRYRQVYNVGPLDSREPLYHSDPFFIEFNGVPDKDSVYGIFIDNPAQICVDIGYLDSSRYMLGTRFGDLDYYFFLGEKAADILNSFTAIIGRPRLKPRYVLGYHQGCYGYEDRGALEWVVRKYREYRIPLDGLHVDVDIQNGYRTFTIDTTKFPNPQQMFAQLREQGVKCSTNITPIISNKEPSYSTYIEGRDQNFFVSDKRHDPNNPDGKIYQDYDGGFENNEPMYDPENNFNSGRPYIGEVFYGGDRGTNGHYPDLGRKEAREWWGKQYKYLFEMGLEMVWQDMTTPAIRDRRGDMRGFPFQLLVTDNFLSDTPPKETPAIKVWNLYSYNLHKATYHGLNYLDLELEARKNKRNFIIGRGSFAGMHRFAGLWTGDNASSWDFLRINVSQVLSVGMCGLTICGQDIGGFEKEGQWWEQWASPELLIRWTVAGAFLPWFRNHYIRKGQKDFQEPFMYEEWFKERNRPLPEPQDLYRMVIPICRYYIELRYRLLQLFYDAMFENIFDGMPICRPMFLNDPYDKALYNDKIAFLDDQFFVRKDLLIAPLLDPQSNLNSNGKRDIYLPRGSDWYCFMDNKKPLAPAVEGGTTVRGFDARLYNTPDHIGFIVPIYVRAGAILPTLELEQYVGERNSNGQPNPITLNIYPGEQGEYTMYLDDGISRSSAPKDAPQYKNSEDERRYSNSEYRETRISHTYIDNDKKIREIKVERIHDNYTPKFEEYFFVAILHAPDEPKSGPLKSIKFDGQEVRLITGNTPEQRADELSAFSENAWYYNESIYISFLKVFDDSRSLEDDGKTIKITVEYV
jgi:alpha-glucosidase